MPLAISDYQRNKALYDEKITEIGRSSGRDLLAADIEKSCLDSSAFLFADGSDFFVLKPMRENGEIVMLVWVAYCKKGDAVKKYQKFIEGVCERVGASRLQFYTNRNGFSRLAPKVGYSRAYTVWEKVL